jgi:membrane-associated HD superfamily phosphohydrolase
MDFANLVETVAKKLGVTIDKIYPMLQQRMVYDMHMDIFWSIFGLIMIITCVFIIWKLIKNNEKYIDDWKVITCFMCICIIIISMITTACCINEIVYIYQSPDYYMLQLLKNIIK